MDKRQARKWALGFISGDIRGFIGVGSVSRQPECKNEQDEKRMIEALEKICNQLDKWAKGE